jgi:hypothetical protein
VRRARQRSTLAQLACGGFAPTARARLSRFRRHPPPGMPAECPRTVSRPPPCSRHASPRERHMQLFRHQDVIACVAHPVGMRRFPGLARQWLPGERGSAMPAPNDWHVASVNCPNFMHKFRNSGMLHRQTPLRPLPPSWRPGDGGRAGTGVPPGSQHWRREGGARATSRRPRMASTASASLASRQRIATTAASWPFSPAPARDAARAPSCRMGV